MWAIDRAFYEVVECEHWQFDVELGEGAIAQLATLQDLEVPENSRWDLLIAQNATERSEKVLRAIARLFVSLHLPDRIQSPSGQLPDEPKVVEDYFDFIARLERQAARMPFSKPGESESREALPEAAPVEPPKAHHLNEYTITSVHIRTIRANAERTQYFNIVELCDAALAPPVDPLIRALSIRRQLASYYNAMFFEGQVSMGHFAVTAWRKIALAAGRFFDDPDQWIQYDDAPVRIFDPLAEAHALIRDVRPEDVPYDAQDELQRLKTAKAYDLSSLRTMGRLYSYMLSWRLHRVEDELGRSAGRARDGFDVQPASG